MVIGYARVSTKGQQLHGNSFEEQRKVLIENGCSEVYEEQFTGRTTNRPILNELIERTQAGKEIARMRKGFKEGRPPTPEAKINHAIELLENNSYNAVAAMNGLSKSTLVRWRRRKEKK